MANKYRTVELTAPAQHTLEGGGVPIRRVFPTNRLDEVDPFLLFDHLGPLQIKAGQPLGFPDHPHRGFETVTYLLEGVFDHKDSFGNRGTINPGGVQWMTAGSGLVHSEMPGAELIKNGGTLHGFQIWVNLPAKDKMSPPRYQERDASAIPVVKNSEGTVTARVVAGEALGQKGAVETHTPILYVHFTLEPGASVEQHIPASYNAVVYTVRGEVTVNDSSEPAAEGKITVLGHNGDQVRITGSGQKASDVLVIAGEPLREPIARYGPFVMNTEAEIRQAFVDYSNGRMGTIS